MPGRGAGDRPLTYEGEWAADVLYHPRQVVTLSGTAYLAVARSYGTSPGTDPFTWLPLGGGGDSEHNGTGTDSTAVGTAATAAGASATSIGDDSAATADYSTVGGAFATVTITSTYSTVYGFTAHASNEKCAVFGAYANATGDESSAYGQQSAALDNQATALGSFAEAHLEATAVGSVSYAGDYCTSVGKGASTGAYVRALALGQNAAATANDQAMVKADELELVSSSGGSTVPTSVILRDTADGSRQRISITSGAVVVAAA